MSIKRFESILVSGLSVGVGALAMAAFSPGLAGGGPMVSLGVNPVQSFGGAIGTWGAATVMTADGGDFLIQDLILTVQHTGSGLCQTTVQAKAGSDVVGEFVMAASYYPDGRTHAPTVVSHRFESGLNVPDGSTLLLSNSSACGVSYAVAGRTVTP